MDKENHMEPRLCSAKSKQSGKGCKRRPIPGGAVCVMHGGGAPQVKAKARERLAALVDPSIDTLAHIVSQREDRHLGLALAASRDVLDRAGYGADQDKQPQDNRTLILNLVGGKPQENVREMALNLLRGANGNGHR